MAWFDEIPISWGTTFGTGFFGVGEFTTVLNLPNSNAWELGLKGLALIGDANPEKRKEGQKLLILGTIERIKFRQTVLANRLTVYKNAFGGLHGSISAPLKGVGSQAIKIYELLNLSNGFGGLISVSSLNEIKAGIASFVAVLTPLLAVVAVFETVVNVANALIDKALEPQQRQDILKDIDDLKDLQDTLQLQVKNFSELDKQNTALSIALSNLSQVPDLSNFSQVPDLDNLSQAPNKATNNSSLWILAFIVIVASILLKRK